MCAPAKLVFSDFEPSEGRLDRLTLSMPTDLSDQDEVEAVMPAARFRLRKARCPGRAMNEAGPKCSCSLPCSACGPNRQASELIKYRGHPIGINAGRNSRALERVRSDFGREIANHGHERWSIGNTIIPQRLQKIVTDVFREGVK